MTKKSSYKTKAVIFWILTAAVMIIIFMFSAQNADDSTEQSSFVTDLLMKIFSGVYRNSSLDDKMYIIESMSFIIRKTAHFSIYASLGTFSYIAVYYTTNFSKKTCIISILICFIYACSDEMHQLFVDGRSCQLRDVFIDLAGAVFMTIIVVCVKNIYRHFKSRSK